MSVVAQDIEIEITVPEGVRPVRVLGNEAEINGQQVVLSLSQIYSEQDRHVVMELEVPTTQAETNLELAQVTVSYRNMRSRKTDRLTATASIGFTHDESQVKSSLNSDVMEDVVALVSNEQNKLATRYLDEGNLKKCKEILTSNTYYLKTNAERFDSKKLDDLRLYNSIQVEELERNDANRARKGMRAVQQQIDSQQRAPAYGSR